MNNTTITVDFNQPVGKIKPMHSTNLGPRQGGSKLTADFTKEFRDMGIPYTRLHDVEHSYGSNHYVDIHCVFPDFDADETLEESYHFSHTDRYLQAIVDAGCQVFYRLGESIDYYDRPLYIHPPKDMEKWARICEHIIRHYNEGWANGFQMGIEYWEIWNEPDHDHMWLGTQEEFFELYRVTSHHLKTCFGDSIKVGGCAFSGFYANNRENPSEWFKTLVPYMHDFFQYITAEDTKSPIDFFSWHCYADSPEEVALHAQYAEDMLKQYHITDCESILDEFNMYYCFSEYSPEHKGCFADLAASMILAQKSSMDMMMHYGAFIRNTYNNFFNLDIDDKTLIKFAGFESAVNFGKLYKLGTEVKTEGDIEGKLNTLAATDGEQKGIMMVSRGYEGKISLQLSGAENAEYTLKITDDTGERGRANNSVTKGMTSPTGDVVLDISQNEMIYLSF